MDQPRKENNPFLETTIENWLTSANELSYQLPFCQLLLSEGYAICHSSKHNAFEQGKDIIAIDNEGTPCAFALKGGNITNHRWRVEVRPEVEELIDYTIVHPSVDTTKPHKSFLVTNGELEDTVRVAIDNLNRGKWKGRPVAVITGGQLLKKFVGLSEAFTPGKVGDYKSFLDLYFVDGSGLIDEEKFSKFIIEVLRLNEERLPNEERRRNIAAAVLYTGYVISAFQKAENHISAMQGLILLAAHILAVAERYGLKDEYWRNSFDVVWMEIMKQGQTLQDEIAGDGMTELVNSIWDGELGPYRRYLAASFLFAFKVAQLLEGNQRWREVGTGELLGKLRNSLSIWGETSFYPFIVAFIITKRSSRSRDPEVPFRLLNHILEVIIRFNGRKCKAGLLSPYYRITTFLERRFGLLDEPIDEQFFGHSYMLKSIIHLLSRYERRRTLEESWREITYISMEEFLPAERWMNFLWQCEEGKTKSEFPKKEQSWRELREAAADIDLEGIPLTLQSEVRFLPLFLLVYPHRIRADYTKFLDEATRVSE